MDLKKRKADQGSADTRVIEVDLWGEKCSVVYRRSQMSPKRLREVAELQRDAAKAERENDGEAGASAILKSLDMRERRLLEVVHAWELLEDGQPIPLTEEELRAREDDVTFWEAADLILRAIAEDQNPNP